VADYVVSQGIDVLVVPETWPGADNDQLTINELVPTGCS